MIQIDLTQPEARVLYTPSRSLATVVVLDSSDFRSGFHRVQKSGKLTNLAQDARKNGNPRVFPIGGEGRYEARSSPNTEGDLFTMEFSFIYTTKWTDFTVEIHRVSERRVFHVFDQPVVILDPGMKATWRFVDLHNTPPKVVGVHEVPEADILTRFQRVLDDD
jgi:hypothetical protein